MNSTFIGEFFCEFYADIEYLELLPWSHYQVQILLHKILLELYYLYNIFKDEQLLYKNVRDNGFMLTN